MAASTSKQSPGRQGKLSQPTDGDYCWVGLLEGVWQQRGTVRACDSLCDFAHVYEGDPRFVFSSVHACVWDVCGWGRGVKRRMGAWQLNSRCLKSVGLTGRHQTAWLMESFGKSSPAVLMNLEPKSLIKRAPFAKTVPQLDLP